MLFMRIVILSSHTSVCLLSSSFTWSLPLKLQLREGWDVEVHTLSFIPLVQGGLTKGAAALVLLK